MIPTITDMATVPHPQPFSRREKGVSLSLRERDSG
jgi:hypothetical protein